MKKTKTSKPRKATRLAKKAPRGIPVPINRRKEWRFELPLKTLIEGSLPQGKKFKEPSVLKNISSTGAYFCLDSGVIVGSKLNLIIDLPKNLTEGEKVKLMLGGITVRLEQPDIKGKRQGVAVHFNKDFKFITDKKRKK
jgi:hypothetical protein